MTRSTRWLNFLERVGWTLLQALSAEGVLTAWEHFRGELPTGTHALALIALTTVIAAIKNAAAQSFINPTGSTLPASSAPVAAEDVVSEVDPGGPTGVRAGRASDVTTGAPVQPPLEPDFEILGG